MSIISAYMETVELPDENGNAGIDNFGNNYGVEAYEVHFICDGFFAKIEDLVNDKLFDILLESEWTKNSGHLEYVCLFESYPDNLKKFVERYR